MPRRMFSPKIIDSDAFLDMPTSAQSLYFHLGMRADDDGFVGNPKKILRMIGGNDDDLKLLLGKRFILAFESGVIVIKHWRINNLIRKDWYQPTQYLEEKNTLFLKDNGAYTDNPEQGNPLVNEMLTKPTHRLGKVRLGKDNINTSKEVVAIATPVYYGNEEINTLMGFLKEKLGGSPDGTIKENRRFAYLLLGKVKKDYPDQKPLDIIQQALSMALKDTFHAKNATSFKYLYYNFQKIVQSAKNQITNPKYIKL